MKKKLLHSFAKYVLPGALLLMMSSAVYAQGWGYRVAYGTSTTGAERGTALAVDASGNVYVTGTYAGNINFGTGPLGASATGTDGFIAKFNSSGTCLWSLRFGPASGTPAVDEGRGIATDGTSVFVVGIFNGAMTVGSSPTVYNSAGLADGCVIKLNASTGAVQWVSTIGGTSTDNIQAVCIDGSGNPYVSGSFFTSATFTTSSGTIVRNSNGGSSSDLFVARLNGTTGFTEWVVSGGSNASTDNVGGSGICYVPAPVNEIVVGGSYFNAAATYSSTGSGATVALNNSGIADICILRINPATGALVQGLGIGGTVSEEVLGVCYDPFTQDVAITGYFRSNGLTFPGTPALAHPTGLNDDIFYARYTPASNNFVWARAAAGNNDGIDRGRAIASNSSGAVYVTGTFRGTLSVPAASGSLSITNTRTADDVFLVRINTGDGNAQLIGHGAAEATSTISALSSGVGVGTTGNAWITGSFGGGGITFAPLPLLPQPAGTNTTADIFVARFNDPLPLTASQSQTNPTCNNGCNGTATVTPSGGVTPYTYAWSPSGGSAATATGLCPGNYTATITDALGSSIQRNFTITAPATTLSAITTTNPSFTATATNNAIADASCNLIARFVPGIPATNTVSGRVWIEPSVPTIGASPFVQRHYEITPASGATTATGRVTLYFTQGEFNNFNAHPGSTLNLPTGPGDAAGIANLRVVKYPGQTNDNSGMPASYTTGTAQLFNPADADIVWSGAPNNRWEVSLDVTGFSGFIVQTSPVILPVNLTSFSAQPGNGDIQLKWQTAGETENDYFEVERSTDGRNFVAIGQRSGNNGSATRDYVLTDAGAATQFTGKIFYRLKIVSTSGRVEYSSVVIVTLNRGHVFVTGIMPNPFANQLQVAIDAPRSGRVQFRVADMSGRVVLKQQVEVTRGFSTQTVKDAGTLGQGVYMLMVDYEGETYTFKVTK